MKKKSYTKKRKGKAPTPKGRKRTRGSVFNFADINAWGGKHGKPKTQ